MRLAREATGPRPGTAAPLGATPREGGVNFSVWSRDATVVSVLLFDRAEDERPARTIPIDPVAGRSHHYWSVFAPGIGPGQVYGFRVEGPRAPEAGLRFDGTRTLLDPYGRAVAFPPGYDRGGGASLKSVVVDVDAYDWEDDAPLRRSPAQTLIYEAHVRGFTKHPSSGLPERLRGTYAGLIEKIPHLTALGITAVELMPTFAFDPFDAPPGRTNYWGYAPVSFFAPHPGYASRPGPQAALDEFRDMVKALHRAGIEVILDVVYNHTAEGDDRGPTFCWRGFDNRAYYLLEPNRARYANYSGTGNTLNASHPVVRRMILDSLRYWVEVMHVDGFRFDLASILARDEQGRPMPNPPVLWDIESDPALAGVKLIAEAWDAAGLYQVGSFVGDAWREWNGRFRDDARDFFRGEAGAAGRLADRLVGSPSLYAEEGREPEQSVNFVACHDGFTLNDLVAYNHKHNEANGEGGRDGSDDNRSWNCGVEGPTDDPAVEALRNRQIKNFLAATLLSLGMPMILMGDEMRRSQGGNNNAYCQDNETNWLDWSLAERHADVLRFVQMLGARRRERTTAHIAERRSLEEILRGADEQWHGVRLGAPDWGAHSRSFAIEATMRAASVRVYMIFNAYWEPLEFELPPTGTGGGWRRWIDTALPSPDDIATVERAALVAGDLYRAEARSVVALFARLPAETGPA